ncbi:hypothetical protein VTI74DRAFT_367 [Chaetomium olivicolor]
MFLPSPGPLDSVLKKTTETGDIGYFSVGPGTALSAFDVFTRKQPLWSRSAPGLPLASERADISGSDADLVDDQERHPSHRDSTSEIISLYGSDSTASGSDSTSVPSARGDRRSYSMTTCSSRHLQITKSNATVPRSSAKPKRITAQPWPSTQPADGIAYNSVDEPDTSSHPAMAHCRYRPTDTNSSRRSLPQPHMSWGEPGERPPQPPASWTYRHRRRSVYRPSERDRRPSSLALDVDRSPRLGCGLSPSDNSLGSQPTDTCGYDYSEGCQHALSVTFPVSEIPALGADTPRAAILH